MKSGSHPYPFPLGRDLVAGQQGVAVENVNHGDVEEMFSFQQKKLIQNRLKNEVRGREKPKSVRKNSDFLYCNFHNINGNG